MQHHDRTKQRPRLRPSLRFTDLDLRSTVASLMTADTLLITDSYNYATVSELGRAIAVEDTDARRISDVTSRGGYSQVVAIGGCTALDFGRACAVGRWMAAVPTILSNCCLSSNRSVIHRGDRYVSEVTTAPQTTVVSLPTIEANHRDPAKNWSASGLGDLLSAFAAAAESVWALGTVGGSEIFRSKVPICIDALAWFDATTYPLDRASLAQLAAFLHDFSIDGHDAIPVGSEHALYYALRLSQNYPRMVATHGKLVSIGTLITLRAWGEAAGDLTVYAKLREAFAKAGLPLTFADLARIGVLREHLIKECQTGRAGPFYQRLVAEDEASLFDRIFGGAPPAPTTLGGIPG